MFDTHCHLNFAVFTGQEDKVISRANETGVNYFMIPSSDLDSSRKALQLTKEKTNLFAAVGIHPHHAQDNLDLKSLEKLIGQSKTSAVGEIGLDYHQYQKTKYNHCQIDDQFKDQQKILFTKQVKLAKKYHQPIIFHNREAKKDFLAILTKNWCQDFQHRTVFHCCEPDLELLEFAKKNHVFIGVDGDVTYQKKKSQFIKKVPLEMLVLETDSPYLTPNPVRKEKNFPNEPKNLIFIAQFTANIKKISLEDLVKQTSVNAQRLFNL